MVSTDASSTSSSRALSAALRYGVLAFFAGVLWINLRKTLWVGIQGWGRPYWWLDYHHGFVRRGLVGEIFQRVFGRLSETQLVVPVGWEHRACLLILGVVFLAQLNGALRAQVDKGRISLLIAVGAWAAASQFWPTVAYNQGYLDSLVLALAAVAAVLMRARLFWAVGLCLAVGPFIHEYFCFFVPFVLASGRIESASSPANQSKELVGLDADEPPNLIEPHLLWLAAIALAAAAIVILAPAVAATRLEIASMPLSSEDRNVLSTVTLTQALQESLSTCLALFFKHPAFTLKNVIFFAGPGFLATAALLLWSRGVPSRSLWLRSIAGLFPFAALALAWDLSRLLVMVDFTAIMLFFMTTVDTGREARTAVRPGLRWASFLVTGSAMAAALAYLILPMAYVYYPPGPATLFTLTGPLGLPPRTFGIGRLWPTVQLSTLSQTLPSDQKRLGPELLHDLWPVAHISKASFSGWRIAPQAAERLVLFGPYVDLREGHYRVTYHLRAKAGAAACDTPKARINGTTTGERKPITSPSQTMSLAACSWTVRADLDVPKGGSKEVETHLFMQSSEVLLVDRYSIEPAAAQSR